MQAKSCSILCSLSSLKNMGLKVTFVVKGGPVINDATLEDVPISGMDKFADEVITTGTDAVGLPEKSGFTRVHGGVRARPSWFSLRAWDTLKLLQNTS